jgi:hypothetical protein
MEEGFRYTSGPQWQRSPNRSIWRSAWVVSRYASSVAGIVAQLSGNDLGSPCHQWLACSPVLGVGSRVEAATAAQRLGFIP